ncbi:MAG: hypothetical protein RJQ04_14150 [Longimicrobiales bacterium]
MIDRLRDFATDPVGHLRWWKEKAERKARQRELVAAARSRLSPIELSSHPESEVHILTGHRLLGDCLWAVSSLYANLPTKYPLVVHDDGSLTSADQDLLTGLFPGCRIIARSEADAKIERALRERGLGVLEEWRRAQVVGLKVFDVQMYSRGRRVLFMDVDILVMERPDELIEYMEGGRDAEVTLYNEDVENWYAWTVEHLRERVSPEVPERVNSGLMCYSRPELEWERYEEWLDLLDPTDNKFHLEQTLWAMELAFRPSEALPPRYDVHHRHAWDGMDPAVALRDRDHGRPVITQHYSGRWDYKAMFYDAIRGSLMESEWAGSTGGARR